MGKNNNTQKSAPTQVQKKNKSKKESQQSKLQKLVKSNPHFQFLENGKIKCTLTKHEFLPTLQNYEKYLTSKSYKNGLESQFDLTDLQEYLTTHKENNHFLYCRLTGAKIPKKKTAIERHVQSKKFKARLQQILKAKEEEGEEEEFVGEQDEQEQDQQVQQEQGQEQEQEDQQ